VTLVSLPRHFDNFDGVKKNSQIHPFDTLFLCLSVCLSLSVCLCLSVSLSHTHTHTHTHTPAAEAVAGVQGLNSLLTGASSSHLLYDFKIWTISFLTLFSLSSESTIILQSEIYSRILSHLFLLHCKLSDDREAAVLDSLPQKLVDRN
jgi:hypothetical protein